MLQNYVKITLRSLRKHLGYSLVNVVGLGLGIACCMLILLYVQDERSYDRFHENADRLYRVVEYIGSEGGGEHSASAPIPVGKALRENFPHLVDHAVRFFNFQAPTLALAYGNDRKFNEPRLFFTDPAVFEAFSFELLRGNPQTALLEPNTMVLTEAMARKYFGDEDPIGKVLRFEEEHPLTVTGVLAEMPHNAHFRFDFLASFASLEQLLPEGLRESWYWNPAWTYVLLPEGASPQALATQFPAFVEANFPDVIRTDVELQLQPLTRIHLHSHLDYEIEPNSSMANIYIFSAIALLVLLIACINFMNLSTARSAKRAREVGIRKALGARRRQLVRQFLVEAVLLTFLAVLLGLALVILSLPVFNAFTEKAISLDLLNGSVWLGLTAVALGVGLLAGIYPAFVLSAFQPVRVLKSSIFTEGRSWGLRKVLVVAQFSLSIALIAGTIIAYHQLRHLLSADVGFEREQVVMLPVIRSPLAPNYETFKDELLERSGVTSVTALEEVLGAKHQTGNYQWESMTESRLFARLFVRHDFTRTFDVDVVAGRDYDEEIETDQREALIINEAMARQMGWAPDEAVGKRFYGGGDGEPRGRIVGVVEDFHFTSLHQPVQPLVLALNTSPGAFNLFIKYVAVRLAPDDVPGALAHVEQVWQRFVPNRPFDYFFLDERLDRLYKTEADMGRIAGAFALFALLVAGLGLFGLASYMAEQRTREIGVRKVMGASVNSILYLMTREFLQLVLIAFVIAVPLAYLAADRWLDGFAYSIDIAWWVFLLAGAAALGVALLTVSFQSVRAALVDPVKALRYE